MSMIENSPRLFGEFRGVLRRDEEAANGPDPDEIPVASSEYTFGSMTPALAAALPESQQRRREQRRQLKAAGYYSRAALTNLSALRFVIAFGSVLAVFYWLSVAPPSMELWLLGLLVAAPVVAWALPPLLVRTKAAARRQDIERGLPDFLDMLNMCVSQGLTVPGSIDRISREIRTVHPALAEELRIVGEQGSLNSYEIALQNFADRIDSPEVNSMTSLLIQTERVGTSISRALQEYSDGMRSTIRSRADARANSASFLLLFPVALMLLPAVFLFLLGPAIVTMSDFINHQASSINQTRVEAMESLEQTPQSATANVGPIAGQADAFQSLTGSRQDQR